MNHAPSMCGFRGGKAKSCQRETKDRPPPHTTTPESDILDVTGQVNATHPHVFPWSRWRRSAYPLRPRRTGRQVKAFPQTADSLRASPLPRLATCSLNISHLFQNPSLAPSSRRGPLRRLPPHWDDLSVHSSNREPYPVDKLLKFRS